jgi:hypothetical protein
MRVPYCCGTNCCSNCEPVACLIDLRELLIQPACELHHRLKLLTRDGTVAVQIEGPKIVRRPCDGTGRRGLLRDLLPIVDDMLPVDTGNVVVEAAAVQPRRCLEGPLIEIDGHRLAPPSIVRNPHLRPRKRPRHGDQLSPDGEKPTAAEHQVLRLALLVHDDLMDRAQIRAVDSFYVAADQSSAPIKPGRAPGASRADRSPHRERTAAAVRGARHGLKLLSCSAADIRVPSATITAAERSCTDRYSAFFTRTLSVRSTKDPPQEGRVRVQRLGQLTAASAAAVAACRVAGPAACRAAYPAACHAASQAAVASAAASAGPS